MAISNIEKRTQDYWYVSLTFYSNPSYKVTIEQAFKRLNKVIDNIPGNKKVWRKAANLIDDIIVTPTKPLKGEKRS